MDYNWRDDIYYVMGALRQEPSLTYDLPNEKKDDLAYRAAEQIVADNGADYYTHPNDAISEELDELYPGGSMTLWAIPQDSRLYELLLTWYGTYDEMMRCVRNAFEDNSYLYFCTGCGYDIMSADLLDGKADGAATRKFESMIAELC